MKTKETKKNLLDHLVEAFAKIWNSLFFDDRKADYYRWKNYLAK